jgi:hypothetical protein
MGMFDEIMDAMWKSLGAIPSRHLLRRKGQVCAMNLNKGSPADGLVKIVDTVANGVVGWGKAMDVGTSHRNLVKPKT